MRIIPFEVHVDSILCNWFKCKYKTFVISIMHFDWCDGDTSLFEIGWYQGDFTFDILFWWFIKTRILEKWRDRHYE